VEILPLRGSQRQIETKSGKMDNKYAKTIDSNHFIGI
jgi:hypothetical protein